MRALMQKLTPLPEPLQAPCLPPTETTPATIPTPATVNTCGSNADAAALLIVHLWAIRDPSVAYSREDAEQNKV